MDRHPEPGISPKKRKRPTVRPFTVGMYLLRVKELNIHLDELDYLTFGDVMDMLIERGNDSEEWELKPLQSDFDRFAR